MVASHDRSPRPATGLARQVFAGRDLRPCRGLAAAYVEGPDAFPHPVLVG